MNSFFVLFLVILIVGHVSALNCYIDSKGIAEPPLGEVVDKSGFRTLQCNILKEEKENEKVRT
jgi:hypothetical protein